MQLRIEGEHKIFYIYSLDKKLFFIIAISKRIFILENKYISFALVLGKDKAFLPTLENITPRQARYLPSIP